MTYLEHINSLLSKKIRNESLIMFGQNISRGSCLGGLTRGIAPNKNGLLINTTNAENTLTGLGFGLMMGKTDSIFFMKQLDFLLLGIDQLTNTNNIIRNSWNKKDLGSFTIFPIIVDNGYQGPQSSFNNFADICTISNVHGYTITNKHDSKQIINNNLIKPGVRIISVSQRLFKNDLINPPSPIIIGKDNTVFKYTEGKDFTIISFNLSFPEAYHLRDKAVEKGKTVELFSVNSPSDFDLQILIESVKKTGKVVIFDDSKSLNLPHNTLLSSPDFPTLAKKIIVKRDPSKDWLSPSTDSLVVDYENLINKI